MAEKDPRNWPDVINAAGWLVAEKRASPSLLPVLRLARYRGYAAQAAAQVLVSLIATGRQPNKDSVYWAKAIEVQQERLFGKVRTHNRLLRSDSE